MSKTTLPAGIESLSIYLDGRPKEGMREIPFRRLTDGTLVSDALVAVRHGAGGRSVYPCAIRFAAHERIERPMIVGPESIDRFRGLQAEVLGWANREDLGFAGAHRPTAAKRHWDPDLASNAPNPGFEPAPMVATDLPVRPDQIWNPGSGDDFWPSGPNYYYYGIMGENGTGRPMERTPDGASVPISGLRAVWAIGLVHPATSEAAHELATLSREITDLVVSHESPLALPLERESSRLTPRPVARFPRARLSAYHMDNGQWRISEYDNRRWQGVIGYPRTSVGAVLGSMINPQEIRRVANEHAERAAAESATGSTRLRYLYRDGSNYRAEEEIVLPGRLTEEEVGALQRWCAAAAVRAGVEQTCFLPTELGLPAAQGRMWERHDRSEDDHVWNELVEITPGDTPAHEGAPHALSVLGGFAAAARSGWDVSRAVEALGLDGY